MTAAWWTGFYHQRQGTWSFSAPFGRASPSVVNRLTKAGSLLTSTSSMLSVRAMPSVTQAATPMRPSAPWWTRTTDVSKSRFYRPLQSPLCTTRQKSKPRESNPTTKRLCQQDCKSAPKNKWRSHIGDTGWDRHKKRGWTQSHGQSKNTHYIPGFIHPQRVPSRIRTGNSPRIGKRARNPCATNTPTRAIGTMCEIKRRYQQASRIGFETESHLT